MSTNKEPKSRKRKNSTMFSKKKKKKMRLLPLITTSAVCCFCHDGEDSIMGTFFKDQEANIAAHQYCLLFSAGLPQKGDDNEGFEGFLLKDLLREARRTHELMCSFCHKTGANAGCCKYSCKTLFHYKCGLRNGIQFIFTGAFNTYCSLHRSYQDLSDLKRLRSELSCPICLDSITCADTSGDTVLKTPCCKHVYVHRKCVQRQANISGYFFRCPICNNSAKFSMEMSKYGIYIPSRDAAWEECNAYSDLLEQYDKCDVKNCKCSRGRKHCTYSGKWHLIRCYLCGQSAVHVKCLGTHYLPGFGYVCVDCNSVANVSRSSATILQPNIQDRWKEHKRRLLELTSRDDPVLLASAVFGKKIWCKKFNVTECNVSVVNLSLPLGRTKFALKDITNIMEKQDRRMNTSENFRNVPCSSFGSSATISSSRKNPNKRIGYDKLTRDKKLLTLNVLNRGIKEDLATNMFSNEPLKELGSRVFDALECCTIKYKDGITRCDDVITSYSNMRENVAESAQHEIISTDNNKSNEINNNNANDDNNNVNDDNNNSNNVNDDNNNSTNNVNDDNNNSTNNVNDDNNNSTNNVNDDNNNCTNNVNDDNNNNTNNSYYNKKSNSDSSREDVSQSIPIQVTVDDKTFSGIDDTGMEQLQDCIFRSLETYRLVYLTNKQTERSMPNGINKQDPCENVSFCFPRNISPGVNNINSITNQTSISNPCQLESTNSNLTASSPIRGNNDFAPSCSLANEDHSSNLQEKNSSLTSNGGYFNEGMLIEMLKVLDYQGHQKGKSVQKSTGTTLENESLNFEQKELNHTKDHLPYTVLGNGVKSTTSTTRNTICLPEDCPLPFRLRPIKSKTPGLKPALCRHSTEREARRRTRLVKIRRSTIHMQSY